jgi:sugar/nucleoside kinase (ribokinase family)
MQESFRHASRSVDDATAEFQPKKIAPKNVGAHPITAHGSASVLMDEIPEERTVFSERDRAIAVRPQDINKHLISDAAVLSIKEHDTAETAPACAACSARGENILAACDFDNLCPGVQSPLEYTHFMICSKDPLEGLAAERSFLKSLPMIREKFRCHLMTANLKRSGALCRDGARFYLCRGYKVAVADAVGDGNILHGLGLYALIQQRPIEPTLEIASATAAPNCKRLDLCRSIPLLAEINRAPAACSPPKTCIQRLLEVAAVARKAHENPGASGAALNRGRGSSA